MVQPGYPWLPDKVPSIVQSCSNHVLFYCNSVYTPIDYTASWLLNYLTLRAGQIMSAEMSVQNRLYVCMNEALTKMVFNIVHYFTRVSFRPQKHFQAH